jgi:hypothetical protein
MALNTETGIDPVVDRFVIKSLATGNVINFSAFWPRGDGGAIQGGNPDLQYFKRVANDPPDIDHRYELQSADVFALTTPAPADGLPVGTFGTTYTPVKLELNTLLAQIETEFQQQVRQQFPDTENPATLLLAAKALAKRQEGGVLTADEEASLNAVTSVGDAVDQLVTRRQELLDAAEADQDYDLTVWPVLT